MAVCTQQFKGTVTGKSGGSVNFFLDCTCNSQSIENNSSNVTFHAWAQATTTNVTTYNLNTSEPTSKIGYAKTGTNYNYVINRHQAMDFRNKKVVDLGTWTGDIPHNSEGKLSLNVYAFFDIAAGSQYVQTGSISGTWNNIPSIARKSGFSATNASVESNSNIYISPAFSGAKHTLTYSFDGLTGTITTKTTNTSVAFTIPSSFYSKFTAKGQTKTCTITCATYSGDTLVGSSSYNITISMDESKCLPNAVINSVADTNTTVTAITGSNQKLIKHVSNVKVVTTASAKHGWVLSSSKVNGINTSGEITIPNVTTGTFTLTAKDNRGFEKSVSTSLTIYDYIPLTASVSFQRKTQTGSEVLLNYSGNYFAGSFGSVANTLALSWAYKEKGATSWINGGTLTPTITGNTYKGSISCGTVFDYQKSYDFIFYYNDKLSGAKNIQQSITKGQGIIEFYQNAIKIFGEELFFN